MQDAADRFTIDILGGSSKRGRGRPRVENPLTPAERAFRYRQRKLAAKKLTARLKANGVTGIYRGPHGETWSGRGLTPKWLQVLIREGRCKQYAHRPGSPYCESNPMGDVYIAARSGCTDDELADITALCAFEKQRPGSNACPF
jgi:hypothetical protein